MSCAIVFGNATLDLLLRLEAFPEPGETVLAPDAMTCAGGKGLNQALAAARTGAPVRFTTALGDDPAGALVRDALAGEANLAATFLLRAAPTDVSTIWIDAAGENMIASSNRAAASLTAADAEAALAEAGPLDLLVLQGNLSFEATRAAANAARAKGARVVLNSAPMQRWIADLLPLTDILVANEVEAERLAQTGAGLRAVRTLVLTRGARGASLHRGGGVRDIAAPKVAAVDTSGAGDVFVGILVGLLALGRTLDDAARIAVGAASISVTRPGTTPSFPSRGDIERLEAGR